MFLHPKIVQPASAARAERFRRLWSNLDEKSNLIDESGTSVGPEAPEIVSDRELTPRNMIRPTDQIREWPEKQKDDMSWWDQRPSRTGGFGGFGGWTWSETPEEESEGDESLAQADNNGNIEGGTEDTTVITRLELQDTPETVQDQLFTHETEDSDIKSAPIQLVPTEDNFHLRRKRKQASDPSDQIIDTDSDFDDRDFQTENTEPVAESPLECDIPVYNKGDDSDADADHRISEAIIDPIETVAIVTHHAVEVNEETVNTPAYVRHHEIEVMEDMITTPAQVEHHRVRVEETTGTTVAQVAHHQVEVNERSTTTTARVEHHRVQVAEGTTKTVTHVEHHTIQVEEETEKTVAHVVHHAIERAEETTHTVAHVEHHTIELDEGVETTVAHVEHHTIEVDEGVMKTVAHVEHHVIELDEETKRTLANVEHHAVSVMNVPKESTAHVEHHLIDVRQGTTTTPAYIEHHSVEVAEGTTTTAANVVHHQVRVEEETLYSTAQVQSLTVRVERQPVVIPVTVPEFVFAVMPSRNQGVNPILIPGAQMFSDSMSQGTSARSDSSALGSPVGDFSDLELDSPSSSPPPGNDSDDGGGGGDPGNPRGGTPPPPRDDIARWVDEVTRRLRDVETLNQLRHFITWIQEYDCPEWTRPTPRPILHIMRQENLYVGIGRYGCPQCSAEFDSTSGRDRHRERHHPKANQNLLSACLETVTRHKLRWKVAYQDGRASEWKNVCRCPFPDCNYVGTLLSSLGSHIKASHREFHEEQQRLGTLWALMIHGARASSTLYSKEDLARATTGYICSNCRWFIGKDKSTIGKHGTKQHPDHPVEGQQVASENVTITPNWLHERNNAELIEEAENQMQRDQTRMNAIRTAAAGQVHANLPQAPPEIANEDRRRRQEREQNVHRQRRQIENPAFPPSEHSQVSDSSEPDEIHVEHQTLRQRAEQWMEACEEDEKAPIFLPKIWGEKAAKFLPKLRLTFDGEIQALLHECENADPENGEEEWIILEGLIAKVSLTVRERIRELSKMTFDDQRGRHRPVVREPSTIHRCLPSNRHIMKFFSNIEMLRHLRRKRAEDGNIEAGLLEQTVQILQLLPDEVITAVGGREARHIEELIQEEDAHREDRLDYLRAQFLALQRRLTAPNSSAFKQLIQKMYHEDPGRALDWFILSEPTPECQIPIEDIADFYGEKWEDPVQTHPDLWHEFPLTSRMRNEDKERLQTMLLDADLIQQVISSRSNLSAQGVDGICNGAWKANPKITVRLIQYIIRMMLKHGKAPEAWKRLKTILLYKKGNAEELSAWRPITLSPTLYRITMCHIARVIQTLNTERRLISPEQKGFVKTPAGILEHTQMLQEYTCDACRQRKSLYLAFIDLRDAFGSLPHSMIQESLKLKGFDDDFTNMVMAMYVNSQTQFRRSNQVSRPVGLQRGVKQGCPLSPTLFNLAIDGLISSLARSDQGYRLGDDTISVQAYADDIVILSDTEEGLQQLLNQVTRFCELSKLAINPAKCATLSYTHDGRKRTISSQYFQIAGEDIPPLTLMSATDYLGIYIGARSNQRKHHIMRRIESVRDKCSKVVGSPLKFTQKCDAFRRFLAPQLEYEMLAGICPQKALRTLDKNIRNMFQRDLGAQGLPTELFHLDWRNGGLSFTELSTRARVLTIHAFIQLHDSTSTKTGKFFRHCCSDETEHRRLQRDPESPTLGIAWSKQSGTSSLLTRTVKALNKLHLGLKKVEQQWTLKDVHTDGEHNIDRHNFLRTVKDILQQRYCEEIDQKPLKGHSFESLRDSAVSNFWIHSKAPTSDSIVRFALRARTNSFFTREVAHHSNAENDPACPLCGGNESLMHILNGCRFRKAKFVPRHNAIASELVKLLKAEPHFQGIIHLDSTLRGPRGQRLTGPISERRFRPDLWWWQHETLHIAEITVPYANLTTQGRETPISTLELRRDEKERKYAELVNESERQFNCRTKLHVIVVSSLGAVPKKTVDELKTLTTDHKLAILTAKRMGIAALRESMKIYHDFEGDQQIDPEIQNLQQNEHENSETDGEDPHPDEAQEPEAEEDPAVPMWVDDRLRDLFRDQAREISDTTGSDDEADEPRITA